MKKHDETPHLQEHMAKDMGKGFGQFADEVLRGRQNHTILNTSAGLAALQIGLPQAGELADASSILLNNRKMLNPAEWDSNLHPLFDFNPENFTLFGLDFPDFWQQILKAFDSSKEYTPEHIIPIYEESIGSVLGLAALPFGEMAHLLHIGMGVYDSGRTFQDLWRNPELNHNILKIATHPDMLHTLAHKGTMLTVMGLLHPMGPVVAIGVAYLCAHLVHSFFELLDDNRAFFQKMQQYPILSSIYDHSGIKEWSEAKQTLNDSQPQSSFVQDMPSTYCATEQAHRERLHTPLAAQRVAQGAH